MKIGLIGSGNMARAMARGWGEPVLCTDSGSGQRAGAGRRARRRARRVQPRARRARRSRRALPQALPARRRSRDEIGDIAKAGRVGARRHRHARRCRARYPDVTGVRADAEHAGRGPPGRRRLRRAPTERALRRSTPPSRPRCSSCSGAWAASSTVPERLLGAATAISGVGPAYQALLAEAQIDAAVRQGSAPQLAAELVTATMTGSAALIEAKRLRHARRPARGDLARRIDRPRARRARACRHPQRLPGRDRRGRRTPARSALMLLAAAVTRDDIANYVGDAVQRLHRAAS